MDGWLGAVGRQSTKTDRERAEQMDEWNAEANEHRENGGV